MSEEALFEINCNKTPFHLRIREYNGYLDLDSVNSGEGKVLKIVTLYSNRDAAINQDMFSEIKKILVESPTDEDIIAYIDDAGIACIEYLNGEILKEFKLLTDINLFDNAEF